MDRVDYGYFEPKYNTQPQKTGGIIEELDRERLQFT